MTGTSIDGLDAAFIAVEGRGLEEMKACVVGAVSLPLGDLAARLRTVAEQAPVTAGEVASLMRELALLHVEACERLCGMDTAIRPDLVCVHGQTVYHKPPLSWQLMQPAPIAAAMRCPVVFDLRAADIAASGQGAPLTPIADYVLFRAIAAKIAVVNLGGFANITRIERDMGVLGVTASDLCPCNNLLDGIARLLLRKPFDEGGSSAIGGSVDEGAFEDLDGIFASLRGPRRSLGTGDETADWISRYRAHLPASDIAATACVAIGRVIADAARGAHSVLLAGGGVLNLALRRAIEANCPEHIGLTDEHGVPATHREAVEWAVLGALCQDRVSIGLPAITGCSVPAPIAGAWLFPDGLSFG